MKRRRSASSNAARAALSLCLVLAAAFVGWGGPHPVAAATASIDVAAQALSDGLVELLWTAVPGADAYDISRDGQSIASQPGTLFDDTGVAPATSYQYVITAKAAGSAIGSSPVATVVTPGAQDHARPSGPTGLTASNLTTSTVTLKWAASTDNGIIVGYRIYRGPAGTPVSQLTPIDTAEDATRYSASKLRGGTAYVFGVAAVDAGNNLSSITALNVTTPTASDPVAPAAVSSSSVTATPFSGSRIDLVWGAS